MVYNCNIVLFKISKSVKESPASRYISNSTDRFRNRKKKVIDIPL